MKRQIFYILFLILLLSSCLESPEMTKGIINEKEKPTVFTGMANPFPIDGNLSFQGEIIEKGKAEIIEKGFYWSTVSQNPELDDNVIISDTDADIFSYELKNAKGEKTYYWRAYAKNSFGYDYGEVQSCQTPNIWIERDSLRAEIRARGAIFTLSNNIYITCGQKNIGHVTDTWEYNITSNSWIQVADDETFHGKGRIYPVVFTIGNFAYVGTGQPANLLAYKDFYRFSAESKNWIEITTPENFEARYEATAFSIDGKGYVIGGFSADKRGLQDVWQYNPESDLWLQKNDFPVILTSGISISDNNRAFAGFGDTNDSSGKLWEYIKEKDEWEIFTDELPDENIRKIYSGIILQNTIYVVDDNNSIWACNLSNKVWEKKSDLPSAILNQGGVEVKQTLLTTGNSNSIYVGLGFTRRFFEYRPLWDN